MRSRESTALEARLYGVLEKYVSRITARGVMRRVSLDVGVISDSMGAQDVHTLTDAIMRGVSIFLAPESRSSLTDELKQLHDPAVRGDETIVRSVRVRGDEDVAAVVVQTRELAAQLHARRLSAQKLTTAVSELARNIALYTTGGTIELRGIPEQRSVQVIASDHGKGIADLEAIMAGHYRSRTGLGKGLRGVKRLADRMHIDTGPTGTRIEAEFCL